MSVIISVDIGTSKICASAYCLTNKQLIACKAVDNSSLVTGKPAGYYEQSAKLTIEYVFSAIKSLLTCCDFEPKDVTSIAVTGQMHGVLIVDSYCQPVTNLITWRDQRSCELAISIGEKFTNSNGCGLRAGYGGATLALLAKSQKLEHGHKALSISDYLCAVLSGHVATEPTHAASWGIYDIITRQWNRKMVDELSIPEHILPEVIPTSSILGRILPDIAGELGLDEGIVIYSSIGDNQAAVIGAKGKAKNAAVLNLGTGGQISIPQTKGQYIDGFEMRPMPDGNFILVGASICGGWTYAYLKDFFKNVVKEMTGIELKDRQVYDKMNSFLNSESNDTGICLDPTFSGTRTDPTIRGMIKSIDTHNFTPKNMTIAFATAMILELGNMIPPKYLNNFSTIIVCGNAIRKNQAILKIIAKCFGKPVYMAEIREKASMGAAIAAMKIEGNYIKAALTKV